MLLFQARSSTKFLSFLSFFSFFFVLGGGLWALNDNIQMLKVLKLTTQGNGLRGPKLVPYIGC